MAAIELKKTTVALKIRTRSSRDFPRDFRRGGLDWAPQYRIVALRELPKDQAKLVEYPVPPTAEKRAQILADQEMLEVHQLAAEDLTALLTEKAKAAAAEAAAG